ncbi:MAG: hypothetical protein M3R21_02415 [Candidatus Dormibacteraeota bacterium]|nr:hypothetical protein [Candidatus Dormibacteraeota bacterium]
MVALGGVIVMAFIGLYVMGASATNAWHAAKSDTAHVQPRASVVASSVGGASDVKQQGESAAAASTPSAAPASPAVLVSMPAAIAKAAAPSTPASVAWQAPVPLIVHEGRTALPDSLVAERGGDSVSVDFDTPAARTRRRDKFEGVIRRTLPLVYGAPVDSLLRAIPIGGIVGDADLLEELPTRGIHLKVADGWTLDLWPETRAGQDGPLVVGYRARISKDGALR